MDFIFMLTQHDRTVADCLEVMTTSPISASAISASRMSRPGGDAGELNRRIKRRAPRAISSRQPDPAETTPRRCGARDRVDCCSRQRHGEHAAAIAARIAFRSSAARGTDQLHGDGAHREDCRRSDALGNAASTPAFGVERRARSCARGARRAARAAHVAARSTHGRIAELRDAGSMPSHRSAVRPPLREGQACAAAQLGAVLAAAAEACPARSSA